MQPPMYVLRQNVESETLKQSSYPDFLKILDSDMPRFDKEGVISGDLLPRTQSLLHLASIDSLKKKNEWRSLDVFRSTGSVDTSFYSAADLETLPASTRWGWLWVQVRYPVLVAVLAVVTAFIGIASQLSFSSLHAMHISLVSNDLSDTQALLKYVAFSAVLALLSCWVTLTFCPQAVGGGIPEVKVLLSGMEAPTLLSFRLIVAKTLGLIFGMSSGISAGTQGPLIHISCAVAERLMSWRPFLGVKKDTSLRLDVLAHACAAGIATTFGTPFAAMLFSIEVTATAYKVTNLLPALFTSVTVCLVLFFLGQLASMQLFRNTYVQFSQGYTTGDLSLLCALALSCGLLASLFIVFVMFVNAIVTKLKGPIPSDLRLYALTLGMILIIAPIAYLDCAMGIKGGQKTVTADLFNPELLSSGSVILAYFPLKVFVTVVSINMPLPVGLFDAVFLIGGCIGRLVGMMCVALDMQGLSWEPWEFAVAGAVFFSSAVTHTLAPAVVVYELAGARMTSLPVCMGTFIAYGVSSVFTKSIYEMLIRSKQIPYLPDLPTGAATIPAFQLMLPVDVLPVLTLNSTYEDAANLLEDFAEHDSATHHIFCPVIPIVDGAESKKFVGTVSWNDVSTAVAKFEQSIKRGVILSPPNRRYKHMNTMGFDVTAAPTAEDSDLFRTKSISKEDIDGLRESLHGQVMDIRRSFHGQMDSSRASQNSQAGSERRSFDFPWVTTVDDPEMPISRKTSMAKVTQPNEVLPVKKESLWESFGKKISPVPIKVNPVSSPQSPVVSSSPRKPGIFVTGSYAPDGTSVASITRLHYIIQKEGDSFVDVFSPDENLYVIEKITIPLNPSPFQIVHTTELGRIDSVFRMMTLDVAFVTRCGQLVGALTREALRQFFVLNTKNPLDESLKFCGALGNNLKFC